MAAYGHAEAILRAAEAAEADRLAREAAVADAASRPTAPPVDPALYERPDVREMLAAHDIAALFRVLKKDAGLSYRQIAALIGVVQSEVSSILTGREVKSYAMLRRIADGLGIPRGHMGLGDSDRGAYPGEGDHDRQPRRGH